MTIFETHLVAIKYGFHLSEPHRSFIRISTQSYLPPTWVVEVIPENDYEAMSRVMCASHLNWWQRPQLLDAIERIRSAKGNYCPRQKLKFIVDENGNEVKPNPFEVQNGS